MRNYSIISVVFSLLVLLSSPIYSQFGASNFNSNKNWTANKRELFFSIGGAQFMGDLGGRDRIGTTKSIVDWDWKAMRFGGSIGYRYRFHARWATSTHLSVALISGDDAHTNEIIRNSRNLHFRSPIVDLAQRLELIVYANERVGARHRIPGIKGMRTSAELVYLFSGIGGFYFNPQAKINNVWTNLHPLTTEGQGLEGGADPYKRINVSIPFGVGFKVGIGQFWRVGMEFTYHMTFTDYIDDVSTNYYNPNALSSKGAAAVYASNPAKANHIWFAPGQQRGNPDDDDAFFTTNIVFTRNITYPKTRGYTGIKWKGRTKF